MKVAPLPMSCYSFIRTLCRLLEASISKQDEGAYSTSLHQLNESCKNLLRMFSNNLTVATAIRGEYQNVADNESKQLNETKKLVGRLMGKMLFFHNFFSSNADVYALAQCFSTFFASRTTLCNKKILGNTKQNFIITFMMFSSVLALLIY